MARKPKLYHEIRDPLHVFIRLEAYEREILDSRPLQRLRSVHQLGMSHLVYPGATHKRFEHSLGVMELSGRIFDVVAGKRHSDEVLAVLPELDDEKKRRYWKSVLRLAALCHDIGHLPFSHAAENELLPSGWDHERLTDVVLRHPALCEQFSKMTPPVRVDDVVKLALGRKAKNVTFSNWEALLSEIIVGDVFGADRMDYLLRDSHHAGVSYGRFDHHRLIDTMQILPSASPTPDGPSEPALGVEEGGLQSAESLLIARYLMYSQVYFHPVRRIYDIHLKDFLKQWLQGGTFSTDPESHWKITDHEVMSAIFAAADDSAKPGHDPAHRIVFRKHFRLLYSRAPADTSRNPRAIDAIFDAAQGKFGLENVRADEYTPKSAPAPDFPVWHRNGDVVSSLQLSSVLKEVPPSRFGYVYVNPDLYDEATSWLKAEREAILAKEVPEDEIE